MGILDITRRGNVERAFEKAQEYLQEQGASGVGNLESFDTDYDFEANLDNALIFSEEEAGEIIPNRPRPSLQESRAYTFGVTLPPDPRRIVNNHLQAPTIVRRPTVGLIGYEDRFSKLEVIVRSGDSRSGIPVRVLNSSYREGYANASTNFFLQEITETSQEAISVVETFNDFYLSDVGEKPRFLTVQGMLLAAKNFPWAQEWRKNYEQYVRGRQCIIRRAMVYLTICEDMYVGYILDSQMSRSITSSFWLVPFSFTMVLRQVVDVRAIQDAIETSDGRLVGDNESFGEAGSLFVQGIRIPDTIAYDATVQDIQEFSLEQKQKIESEDDSVKEMLNLRNAVAAEIIQGEIEGIQRVDAPALTWKEGIDKSLTQWNLNRLLAVARALNARAGTEVYNLQRVATGYAAQYQEDLIGAGLYDEYGPATFGLPTEYQSEVDARRRRQQEELLQRGRDLLEEEFGRIDWL